MGIGDFGLPNWSLGGIARGAVDTLGDAASGVGRFLGSAFSGAIDRPAQSQATYLPQQTPSYGLQSYFDAALGSAQSRYAGVRTGLQNDYQRLADRASGASPSSPLGRFAIDEGQMRTNYSHDENDLINKGYMLDVDRDATKRQSPLLDARGQLAMQLRKMLDPEYQDDAGNVNRLAERDMRYRTSDATGKGALGSRFFREDMQDIRAGQTYALDGRYRQYQRDVGRTNLDITQNNEDKAANADRERMIGLQAQQMGLDKARLKTNLTYGLKRLGLDKAITQDQLWDMARSKKLEDQMMFQRVMSEAMQQAPAWQSTGMAPSTLAALGTGR